MGKTNEFESKVIIANDGRRGWFDARIVRQVPARLQRVFVVLARWSKIPGAARNG